jgi:hypothetical protein
MELQTSSFCLTRRPLISDDFVNHLRNGSVISAGGLKRFIDSRYVELEDGSLLKVDAMAFGTGYTADFSLMPENSRTEASCPSKAAQRFHVPPLARLYKNIFLPSHMDSIAYLWNWTIGDGIMPVSDLASIAITQVLKGNFPLPSEEQNELRHRQTSCLGEIHGGEGKHVPRSGPTRFTDQLTP